MSAAKTTDVSVREYALALAKSGIPMAKAQEIAIQRAAKVAAPTAPAAALEQRINEAHAKAARDLADEAREHQRTHGGPLAEAQSAVLRKRAAAGGR